MTFFSTNTSKVERPIKEDEVVMRCDVVFDVVVKNGGDDLTNKVMRELYSMPRPSHIRLVGCGESEKVPNEWWEDGC